MMDAATVNSDAADFSIEVTDKRMAVRVNCLADETDLEPLAPRIVEKLVALAIADAPDADTVARLLSEQAAHGLHINGMILVQGQPPVAPVDGSIEWLGNFFDSGFQVDDETGAIDYRQHAAQVAVAKDQLLARLIAPCDGVEGHDVFGNRIPVAKAKAARLRIGANVRTDESGMEFYAAMDGRIRYDNDMLVVDPVCRIPGNVDLAVGNIVHPGAVVVEQDVLQGARIEAAGDIEIMGSTEAAHIVCGGTLVVHGAILGGEGMAIRVKGGVRARLIAGADIEAGADVVVEREIVNTRLKTCGKLQMTRGRLVGGEVMAHGGAVAGQLGSPGAVRTVVIVGEDYTLKPEVELRERQAAEFSAKLATYEDRAKTIRQHMDRLSPKQQEMAMLLFVEVDSLRDNVRRLHAEIDALREASRARAKPMVDATSVVHAETLIGMRGEWMHVKEEIPGPVRFRIVEGAIAARPLNAGEVDRLQESAPGVPERSQRAGSSAKSAQLKEKA